MPVRFSVGPLFSGRLQPAADGETDSDALSTRSGARRDRAWPSDRLELPVTRQDAALNRDRSAIRLHRKAEPTHTLTLDEIVAAPEERRAELLRRFRDLLATKAGPSDRLDPSRDRVTIADGPWRFTVADGEIEVVAQPAPGERYRLHIDVSTPTRPQVTLEPPSAERGAALALLLDGFQCLLCKPGHLARTIDPKAAELFDLLLGPGGILNPQDRQVLAAGQRFRNPKLIAWDFNGTVGDGRGSFRPDMRDVTDNLNRMGALSVITTTIDPVPIEMLLAKANIHFNAFYGGGEVRQYPQNKHYQELAKTYGLDGAATAAQMVVIGDSQTDIPSDTPGVIFINNDDQTPAEVIQLLLHRLDELGEGDFARGLKRALGSDLRGDERRVVELAPMSFTVELRNGANLGDPCLVPTIHRVRVDLDDRQLADLLTAVPATAELEERAHYDLGFRYIECILPEERLPGLLRRLAGIPDQKTLIASGRYRLEERRALVETARAMVQRLRTEPDQLPMKRILSLTEALAAVGDDVVATGLADYAARFSGLNPGTRDAAVASLDEDRERLRELLRRARGLAADGDGSASAGGDGTATTEAGYFGRDARAMMKLFARAAAAPLSPGDEARERLLASVKAYLDEPFPQAAPLLAEMEQNLDLSFAAAAAKLGELFAEREARAAELNGPAADAARQAPVKQRLWAEAETAWDELVAAQR